MRRVIAALCLAGSIAGAQQPIGAVALGDLVRGLGVNTRVLVIGAHPDDEDTYLISWLARGHQVETAYLSLTRGEGGQNLVGNELGAALGQIRTQELLAARRIDGGSQFFTRAVDFGFSKTLEETSERWPREAVLEDVVAVIRSFRPHVIVSIWTGTPADGHGHHQYSGVIAKEAFIAAADPSRFPGVGGMGPWSTAKLYRVARVRGGFSVTPNPADTPGNVKINVGEYDPLLGRSYADIAAISRSQHRSQGMGVVAPLGDLWDGLILDTSRVGVTRANDRSIFDGIDTTWGRVRNDVPATVRGSFDSLAIATRDARESFDALRPSRVVAPLSRVLRLAARLAASTDEPDAKLALERTIGRATEALLLAAGVRVEAMAAREEVAVGDSVDVTVAIFNRGRSRVELTDGEISVAGWLDDVVRDGVRSIAISPDSVVRLVRRMPMQQVTREPNSEARLSFAIGGARARVIVPLVHRFADPVLGERRHPLVGVPRFSLLLPDTVEYAPAGRPINRDVRVQVTSASRATDTVALNLSVPSGLSVDTATRRVILGPAGRAAITFRISGMLTPGAHVVRASIVGRDSISAGFVTIDYPHIPPVRQYQPAAVRLAAVELNVPANLRVAYVRGVGDNVEPTLSKLGLDVRVISPEEVATLDPARTSTLVIGPRALEAIDAVTAAAGAIQDFARRGGTVVTQYTQNAARAGILPYPITLPSPAPRVADETAAVRFLDPSHRLMTSPNRITAADFDGWVQERGLYMPAAFDPRWTPLFEMHDPGESPNRGGVLVATVGQGTFVYTTLSFFRQLPAGHAGAARLFVNLLSAGMANPRLP